MSNLILDQFGLATVPKTYEFGIVIEVKTNYIYVVETFKGLKLIIQDADVTYAVGDSVLLGLLDGTVNNAFIVKRSNTKLNPLAENFIVTNGLN